MKPKTFKEIFTSVFFYNLAIELVENILEDIISYGLSAVLTRILSTVLTIGASYGLKRLLRFIVKKITYKEGNDKVAKIKQFFTWVYCNKKTLGGWLSSLASAVIGALAGTGVIDAGSIAPLFIGNFNITPVLFYAILFVFAIIGIKGKGLEKIKEYFKRKEEEAANKAIIASEKNKEKEAKAVIKEAKAKIKKEEKEAKKKAKEEEAKTKAAEKAKVDAEHDKKVEEVKQQLLKDAEEANKNETQNA